MTNKLPPEVAEAIAFLNARTLRSDIEYKWHVARDHMYRLTDENARLQFELHDQQLLAKANREHAIRRLQRAEQAEAERDALSERLSDMEESEGAWRRRCQYSEKRIEGAKTGTILVTGDETFNIVIKMPPLPPRMKGKRVALVKLEDGEHD